MFKFFLIFFLFGLVVNPMLRVIGNWAGYKDGSWPMSATRAISIVAIWHWFYNPISRPEMIVQLIVIFWLDQLLMRLFPPPNK